MKRLLAGLALVTVYCSLVTSSLAIDSNEKINYQGKLINGTNLVNGVVTNVFRLYDYVTGGNLLYAQTQVVTVVDGLYSTTIGSDEITPPLANVLTNFVVFIEVEVNGTTLSPRERISQAAYALTAVRKAGDTMTGTLTIQSNLVLNSTEDRGISPRQMLSIRGGGDVEIGNEANGYNGGAAVGAFANAFVGGAAVGVSANASSEGSALGSAANGISMGAAVGEISYGYDYGVAVGYNAIGFSTSVAVGAMAGAGNGGVAVGYRANSAMSGAAAGYTANGYWRGAAVGYNANGYDYGSALGYQAAAQNSGVAIGDSSIGSNQGVAVGSGALAFNYGVAVGIGAHGDSSGVALGYHAMGYSTSVAVGASATASNMGTAIGFVANGAMQGAAVGYTANGYGRGAVVGLSANGWNYGAAVGYLANAYNSGAAVGDSAMAYDVGAAVGSTAVGYEHGAAMGYKADGAVTAVAIGREANGHNQCIAIGPYANSAPALHGIALGYQASVPAGQNNAAIGYQVTNSVSESTRVRGDLYLDGGSRVFTNGTFGSGAWGVKAFTIDHPLDPQNKVLRHYCVEGPQVWNVYAGTAALDDKGEAMVQLPSYFEKLNTSPQYLLTAVGSAMPNLHVMQRVRDNQFRIAGGTPGGEVCWEVKAVRMDPAAVEDLKQRPVEQLKSELQPGQTAAENQSVNTTALGQ